LKNKRLYRIWKGMRTRCNNPNFPAYKYYGGKGVQVCDEWNSFESFQDWALENNYDDSLTIDRINGDGDYRPDNCRWVDTFVQQNNKSNKVLTEINGKQMTMREISESYGINLHTVLTRFNLGQRGQALIKPTKEVIRVEIKNELFTLEELSMTFNVPWSTIRDRYRKGKRGHELIEYKRKRKSII
jgi:hypothetical protein